ncbi:MAG: hypothetical protein HRT97_01355 [Moritella sp.]|uniref:HTH-like domain-containing protein n=1 Tax=Moritella sp. TaxID=78556 RepID=UPI0025D3495A|nr:hypothetical protein [Moritella sp.]NQZ90968.1 hypothetical protein [Moritella sp.]
MQASELAQILKTMYVDSKDGEAVAMVHLFGIKYKDQIKSCDISPVNIAKLAGISEKYGTEINKGCKLAKYVSVKAGV